MRPLFIKRLSLQVEGPHPRIDGGVAKLLLYSEKLVVLAYAVGAGRASVGILESRDSWLGVTYREDKPRVQAGIAALAGSGVYPSPLFRD